MIVVFVSVCGVVYWLYTHPIVKSLSVMSSSINESKEDNAFICSYAVTETKLLNASTKSNTIPVIDGSFAEFLHHRKSYNSTSLVNSDSLAWVTIILKNDKNNYENLFVNEFSGRFPIYRKLYRLPLPKSISVIIRCDSLNLTYSLEQQ